MSKKHPMGPKAWWRACWDPEYLFWKRKESRACMVSSASTVLPRAERGEVSLWPPRSLQGKLRQPEGQGLVQHPINICWTAAFNRVNRGIASRRLMSYLQSTYTKCLLCIYRYSSKCLQIFSFHKQPYKGLFYRGGNWGMKRIGDFVTWW